MLRDPTHLTNIVIAASAFGLIFSFWIGGVLIWVVRRARRARRLQHRLGLGPAPATSDRTLHLWREGREITTTVPVLGQPTTWMRRLDEESIRAGWSAGGDTILLVVCGLMAFVLVFTFLLTRNAPLALGLAAGMFVLYRIYVGRRIAGRAEKFERQFVEALELAARSLRVGHPLMGAFQLVSEEMAEPVSGVFGEICQQSALGADMDTVLREAAERSTSDDMKLFATSVAIQLRSGGNLASLMDRLADVIRERIRLSRRVRILTAQTQMSKRVLLVLPFVVFFLFTALNPDYMRPFYTTLAGKVMLATGAGLLAAGAWTMNRMARLRY